MSTPYVLSGMMNPHHVRQKRGKVVSNKASDIVVRKVRLTESYSNNIDSNVQWPPMEAKPNSKMY